MVTRSEVGKHASRESCWVIIKDHAYDVTTVIDSHPGGAAAVLRYAGRDATEAFEPIHPGGTLTKYLKPEYHLGPVTGDPPAEQKSEPQLVDSQVALKDRKPRLVSIINIEDFEIAASQLLAPKSLAFFAAGADGEQTKRWNRDNWQSLRFRPRILRPVESVDISTSILGNKYSAPFFICPAGAGKLAHPAGEVLITTAAAKHNILHWVCNMASCTQQEIANVSTPGQVLYWQIYAMNNLVITEQEIKQAIRLGFKGFALTVDAIRPGKRERDQRFSLAEIKASTSIEDDDDAIIGGGISAKRASLWEKFDWISAVKWLRGLTDLPIAVKGIQSWEDATLCMQYGVHPWLSNHGGRQLEGAPSAVEVLFEIREFCPEVFERCEVIVDGGITRGTDIVKALALGTTAVGLGRGFLYSLVFGEAGVSKAISILKQEVETAMVLLGVTSIDQLNTSYVRTRLAQSHL